MTPIVVVGEAWGENEDRISQAFVGSSGIELLRMMDDGGLIELTTDDKNRIGLFWSERDPRLINLVWRNHPEIYRTNVFNLRPAGNKIEDLCGGKATGIRGYPPLLKSKHLREEFRVELERLAEELLTQNPNLVIACGNTPCWALLGDPRISKLRGTTHLSTHTATGFKILPVYHPAAVMRNWNWRPITVVDFEKAKRESAFPEIRRPRCEILIAPTVEDIRQFFATHCKPGAQVAVDIETSGRAITCIGFAPTPTLALVIPFTRSRGSGRNYWKNPESEREAWKLIAGVLAEPKIKKTFQNGMYDISFLWRAYGIKVMGATEDTMLLHHALQPESEKGLGFLGSVYTDHGPWKQQRKVATIKQED
jgi:uracil-DNA glycosylase